MRSLVLIALTGCFPPLEPHPGELVVSGISASSDVGMVAIRNDLLVWTSSSPQGTYELRATAYDAGSCDQAAVPYLGGMHAVAVDDKIYSANNDQIYLVTSNAKLAKLVTLDAPARDLFVRSPNGKAELFWTLEDWVYWLEDGDVRPQRVQITGSDFYKSKLVATAEGIYLSTATSLHRIDRVTRAVSRVVRASDFASSFPRDAYIEAHRGGRPAYYVYDVNVADDRVYALIWEANSLDGYNRGILLEVPPSGGATVLVDTMYEPRRFWIDGPRFYWHERTDYQRHCPTAEATPALWTAPLVGGTASYFMDLPEPVTIDGGYAYAIYTRENAQFGELRRVRLR